MIAHRFIRNGCLLNGFLAFIAVAWALEAQELQILDFTLDAAGHPRASYQPDPTQYYILYEVSTNRPLGRTTSTGTFQPNAWGLYDMHGSVWEWCQDLYGDYPNGLVTDPKGPNTGAERVCRGGAWGGYGRDCRSAVRGRDPASVQAYYLGFRVVLVPVP